MYIHWYVCGYVATHDATEMDPFTAHCTGTTIALQEQCLIILCNDMPQACPTMLMPFRICSNCHKVVLVLCGNMVVSLFLYF